MPACSTSRSSTSCRSRLSASSTRSCPTARPDFRFILIITFELPPIQLGFGFTLNGVGGLGRRQPHHRHDGACRPAFVAHSLDSILFPPDPVANAPEIISNIRNFLSRCPEQLRVRADDGNRLGNADADHARDRRDPRSSRSRSSSCCSDLIDVALPDADAPLIQLHIDMLGTLDFGTKTLEVEGDLYDSSVLIYSMAGSLLLPHLLGRAIRIFIYSVGGFNPHFNTAGLDIPQMQRVLRQHRRRRQPAHQRQ